MKGGAVRRIAGMVVVLGLFGSWAQAGTEMKAFGKGWARGEFPYVTVSGDTFDPTRIQVYVESLRSGQEVSVDWSIDCGDGSQFQSVDETTPFETYLPIPSRFAGSCDVSASALLFDTGRVKLFLRSTEG